MKNILNKHSLAASMLAILCLLPVSCTREDHPSSDKATVTMRFSTRAGEGTLEDREQMKSLRIIVAGLGSDGNPATIKYNSYYDIEDNVTSVTKTFGELSPGTYEFYAIANESGFLDANESLDGIDISGLNALQARTVSVDYTDNAQKLIPQTALEQVTVTEGQNTNLEMELEFIVSKVCVSFINENPNTERLNYVWITNIKPSEGRLFAESEADLPVGANITYSSIVVPAKTENPDGQDIDGRYDLPDVYVYPSTSANGYYVAADWEDLLENPAVKLSDFTEIRRGNQINVAITLKAKHFDVNTNLGWSVNPWGNTNVDVPEFD